MDILTQIKFSKNQENRKLALEKVSNNKKRILQNGYQIIEKDNFTFLVCKRIRKGQGENKGKRLLEIYCLLGGINVTQFTKEIGKVFNNDYIIMLEESFTNHTIEEIIISLK